MNDLLSVDNTYVSTGPFFYALRSLRKKVKICAEKDTAVKLITLRQHLVLRSSWAVTLSQSPFANETQFNSQKKFAAYSTANTPLEVENSAAL
jgi:hypothetical protein